jgi:NTE family protein
MIPLALPVVLLPRRRAPVFCQLRTFLLPFAIIVTSHGVAQQGSPASGNQSGTLTDARPGATAEAGKPAAASSAGLNRAAPAPPPPHPAGRPSIGLALAGGGALSLSEIGVLQWFEEHHIPVDMIAGTSMGALVGALYATGQTPAQLKVVMTDRVFDSVFRIDTDYKNRDFRRREDSRDLPNGLTIGLRHGISLRNAVLTDQGLNSFFDRQFYRYGDRIEFNALPIPFRCLATDLNDASTVTFDHGSLPDTIRASVSLPGIYQPFEINGHEYVDGGVLENLPTQTIHAMHADVTLAVSIPLLPAPQGQLNSILGVLQRSFSVAIEANERRSRTLADVLILPDLNGFSSTDYRKSAELAARGYAAAEQNKGALLKYALDEAQWSEYLRDRASRVAGEPGLVLRAAVQAPNPSASRAIQQLVQPLVGKPIHPDAIESVIAQVRSDGRYNADYTVTYGSAPSAAQSTIASFTQPPTQSPDQPPRPTILVTAADKKTGPPFLVLGGNLEAASNSIAHASVEAILLDQDFGGYGSELRTHILGGTLTDVGSEYFRKLPIGPVGGRVAAGAKLGELFVAPRGGLRREPFDIYQNQVRLSERLLQRAGGGLDLGWTDQRTREFRAGWEMNNIRWVPQVGSGNDNLPNVFGPVQRGRLRFVFDNQDRALVPQFGLHLALEAAYLYHAAGNPLSAASAPQFTAQASVAHRLGDNILVFSLDSGTLLHRNVSEPLRFTLGGPLHLSASAIDEYRGTDFFYLSPVFLRRIASLPQPIGQSIYLGAGYEAGQMRAPDAATTTRQDIFFGIFAETPLGVLTLAPAIGDDGYRKLTFTLGRFF